MIGNVVFQLRYFIDIAVFQLFPFDRKSYLFIYLITYLLNLFIYLFLFIFLFIYLFIYLFLGNLCIYDYFISWFWGGQKDVLEEMEEITNKKVKRPKTFCLCNNGYISDFDRVTKYGPSIYVCELSRKKLLFFLI